LNPSHFLLSQLLIIIQWLNPIGLCSNLSVTLKTSALRQRRPDTRGDPVMTGMYRIEAKTLRLRQITTLTLGDFLTLK
jgi:hypothetical protein